MNCGMKLRTPARPDEGPAGCGLSAAHHALSGFPKSAFLLLTAQARACVALLAKLAE
jgi:hypothetical protein